MKKVIVVFSARGHENILASHKTTFEFTKEPTLTKQGDCIVAVKASKGAVDLPSEFKEATKKEGARITIIIEAGNLKETIEAEGDPQLTFTNPTDLVVRKSNYVCGRTLAIRANKAAADFSKRLVEKVKDPNQTIIVTLSARNY